MEPETNDVHEPDAAVSVRDLSRRFGDFVAVDGIGFDVPPGEVFGFLGPNGAGKSTTIRMLCGVLAPTSGRGSVAGYDIRREAEKIKAHIGYMSQTFSLYEDLTVEENVDFFAGVFRLPRARKKARKAWVLEMAGLVPHRGALTGTLPAGWKQRLALGCAVLHEPQVLFLDEPTSGVDPISRRRFWDLIYALSESGVTVFVTTHYLDEAEYCDRLGLIYRGRLIALGSPSGLKAEREGGAVLEVTCPRAQEAVEAVEGSPAVREAALFGRGLHVAAEDEARAEASIRQALSSRGIEVERIERVTPSLEDVFVSLIESHDAAAGRGGEARA